MKRILLSLITVAALSEYSSAQEGTILVYGNVGYNSTKLAGDDATNSFSFNPGVGYQFDNNWTVGANLGLSSISQSGDKFTSLSAGPFVRYAESLSNTFAMYMQLQGGIVSGKFENEGQPDLKYNGFNAGLFPAVFINVNKSFGLNFSFGGLSYESQKFDGANSSSSILDFNFGQTVNIGISKNFGCKKNKQNF